MLWTHTHDLPGTVHVIEHVIIVELGTSMGLLEQTSQHVNCCGLSSTVVSKKNEDLILIHLDVNAIHSFEAIIENLLQI